jgi:putative transposase
MTNHVHLVMVPKDEKGLARAIAEAHKRYSRMRNFAEGVRGYLFQGRFRSCVLDKKHLWRAVRYVERNPVRARMVNKAWTYPWSSAGYHVGERETDPLVKDRGLWGLVGEWKEYLGERDKEATEALQKVTRSGRPWGDGRFVAKVEKLTGCDLRKGKPGRPRKAQRNQ